MLSLVAAIAKNRVIGRQGVLPWRLPEEYRYFKQIVTQKPVIMGYNTYCSIGYPISQVANLILSRRHAVTQAGVQIISELSSALVEQWIASPLEFMVLGGTQVYQQLLPQCQRLYLSFLDFSAAGESLFPIWHPRQWQVVHEQIFMSCRHRCCARIYQRRS